MARPSNPSQSLCIQVPKTSPETPLQPPGTTYTHSDAFTRFLTHSADSLHKHSGTEVAYSRVTMPKRPALDSWPSTVIYDGPSQSKAARGDQKLSLLQRLRQRREAPRVPARVYQSSAKKQSDHPESTETARTPDQTPEQSPSGQTTGQTRKKESFREKVSGAWSRRKSSLSP